MSNPYKFLKKGEKKAQKENENKWIFYNMIRPIDIDFIFNYSSIIIFF